ncbi:dynamin family protein [Pseudonocardia xishanensis]|uniref:Dynamin N-terminal domain-containing protein n=1 Tax=Pseudonocardia xishanensis TaxID=630995 RepID=A0ABP8RSR1_9PSEU
MNEPDPVSVLRALCADGARRARDATLRAELAAIGRLLDRPLQLAVAGAVGVGKSTLINAMLRRPIAPVDAGECTTLVTWYEHGPREHVLVECRDGTVRELDLVAGRVPDTVGVPIDRVARLRVRLPDPWLRTITVVDTPGMDTVSAENEERTRRLLFGDAAEEHARALLYVVRHVQRFDADLLTELRELSRVCGLTTATTAAVLTQVDRRGDGVTPWPDARRLARRAGDDLGALVLDVVPVVGLLAETARARLLGPTEMAALKELAALEPDELDDLLLDLAEFVDEDSVGPVAPAVRRTLVTRLHRYGLREAVAHLRRHPGCSAEELHHQLAGRSGFGSDDPVGAPTVAFRVTPDDPELGRTLAAVLDRLTRHAGRLTAFAAHQRLARLRGGPADHALVQRIRATVDETRPVHDDLRSLRLLAAWDAVGRDRLRLDAAMTSELVALARHDEPTAQLGLPPTAGPAEIRAAAATSSRRWRQLAQVAGPGVGGQRAHDVLRVLDDIAATGTPPPAPRPPSVGGPRPPLGRQAPPPGLADGSPLDRAALDDLLGSSLLAPAERSALTALRNARGVRTATGAPAGASRSEVAAAAAEVAAGFRGLLDGPLRPSQRRTAEAVAETMEAVARRMRAGGGERR